MNITGAQAETVADLADGTSVTIYPAPRAKAKPGEVRNAEQPIRFARPEDWLRGVIETDGTFKQTSPLKPTWLYGKQ